MRFRIAVIVLFFAACLAPSQARQVNDISGWPPTQWGMTLPQVEKVVPLGFRPMNQSKWSLKRQGTSFYPLLVAQNVPIVNIPCDLRFFFDQQSRLNQIVIMPHDDRNANQAIFNVFVNFLTQKYGGPDTSTDGNYSVRSWSFPTTRVETFCAPGDALYVNYASQRMLPPGSGL